MTTDVKLLPLPGSADLVWATVRGQRELVEPRDTYYTAEQVRDYARANLAELQREVEGLRAEVERIQAFRRHHRARHKSYKRRHAGAEARAERLAEALRDAREYVVSELAAERAAFAGYEQCSNIASIEADLAKIDAALEQETTNE